MNTCSKEARKVVYTDSNGYDWQREDFRKLGYKKGDIFTVIDERVFSFRTELIFAEIPHNCFNSVMFDNYIESTPEETGIIYDDGQAQKVAYVKSNMSHVSSQMVVQNGNLKLAYGNIEFEIKKEDVMYLLDLVERPRIDIVREKIEAGETVFYKMDVPAWRELENNWFQRKHAVEVNSKNWDQYKNGSPENFIF